MPPRPLTAPTKRAIRLAPVRPNIGAEIAYQAKIDRLIAAMNRDVLRQVRATWSEKPPELAQDASPASMLRATMARLAQKWTQRFAEFAESIGGAFGRQTVKLTDRAFTAALRKAGFTVKFRMTSTMNDVMQATIGEQVGLIRSIPAEYLADVQGAVMRSVQTGRDLATLTSEIEAKYGITRRRAALIARDQNNKATASMTRVRQQEIGITEALWMHSAGGRVPRPSHVANNRKRFSVSEGWYDPDEKKRIWPGELINCRCVSGGIVPGI